MYRFTEVNLKEPASTRYQSESVGLKRHVFFYVERTDQNRPQRHFQEVRVNRALHSIWSTERSLHLKVRELAYYCESCLYEEYDACSNKAYVSNWEERELEREAGHGRQMSTRAVVNEQQESLMELKFSKLSPLMGGRIPFPQVLRWFAALSIWPKIMRSVHTPWMKKMKELFMLPLSTLFVWTLPLNILMAKTGHASL